MAEPSAPVVPDGLPIKKTMMLVNAFVVNTTRFLNHFSTLSEEKLSAVSSDISRLEKVLVLLETKLNRLPGLDDATPSAAGAGAGTGDGATPSAPALPDVPTNGPPPANAPAAPAAPAASTAAPPPPADASAATGTPAAAPEANTETAMVPVEEEEEFPARNDPEYAQYVRMLKVGLPEGSVAHRMLMDGKSPKALGIEGFD